MRRFVISSTLAAALALTPPVAHAGSYTVTGTCGSWHAVNHASSGLAIYSSCPTLTVRNVHGDTWTPEAANAAWIFEAPGGARLQLAALWGDMRGVDGWQATVYLQGGAGHGAALENCPSASCPGGTRSYGGSYGAGLGNAIIARVRCGRAGGCYNGAISGRLNLWHSAITIVDSSPPAVGAGGPIAEPGWKGGTIPVVIDASDNVGIKHTQALVDGVPRATQARGCNYAAKVPCPNGADTLSVPLGGFADGQHVLTVQAIDSADNLGAADRLIHVDNTPPVAPADATLLGGPAWRSEDRWSVTWTNPLQKFAPIAAVEYRICPAAADSDDPKVAAGASKRCVSGSRRRAGIARIDDLTVPAPGSWTVRMWLVDGAGNRNPDAAVKLAGLGYDPTPPAVTSFAKRDPRDPARVRVNAADPISGIASGAIEVRRRGTKVWRPLPTQVTPDGLSAFMDDERLRKGMYRLRAVAVNGAGLQHSTRVLADGRPARLRLPVRSPARLMAGRFAGRCKPVRQNRGCRRKLIRRLDGRLDRRTLIRGHLVSGGKALAYQEIEVWRRLAVTGSQWTRIDTERTGRSGRFKYRAPRGPASRIRFRFPGRAQIQGDSAIVKLHVPARTSIRVSRRNVVNGEYVTFRGRVKGAWIPPEGILLELQVFTRRRWRTFAQPRASAETRRWEYLYRFEAIRGDVSFPFRARIRKQSNYPFDTGHSRSVRVLVHGL